MSHSIANSITAGQIVADNDEGYPDDVYRETLRATGKQQWVADAWAEGQLPTHSVAGNAVKLYTSTENFCGYQYPDGHGKLKHYDHLQAIRTHSGLVVADSECYSRGWAKCNTPKEKAGSLPLTTLKTELRGEGHTIYDIVSIDGSEAEFESGAVIDTDGMEWTVRPEKSKPASPLGR